jgi:calcineurin-like phosphoesterase family protein
MSKIYLTSDEHYDHQNIIVFCVRPFNDVSDMQRGLIERHNAVVSKDDVVYHVGDFSMSEKTVPFILPQLNGVHYLVSGNHDKVHPVQKKHEDAVVRYRQYGFAGVYNELRNFHGFLVSHMPYLGQEEGKHGTKYSEYRPVDKGSFLLCGHVHQQWKTKDRMFNVGIDVWDYRPVALDTLISMRDNHNLITKTGSQ